MADRTHLSIGEVLSLLQGEFPDVTISKIRFLESQGLLDPERTPSGYRKFYEDDIARLRWILTQQRDNFLPLKVIKGRLDEGVHKAGDAPDATGDEPDDAGDPADGRLFPMHEADRPAGANGGRSVAPSSDGPHAATERLGRRDRPRPPAGGGAEPAPPGADHADGNGHGNGRSDPSAATEPAVPGHADDPADAPVGATDRDRSRPDVSTFLAGLSGSTLSLDELASVAGVDTELVAELERFGLVRSRRQGPNTVYDDEAVSITRLAAAFVELGLEPRHLRMYKIATERETGIFLQLVGPLLAQRSQPSRADAAARLGRLTGLGEDLRRVLVRRQITDYLGDD